MAIIPRDREDSSGAGTSAAKPSSAPDAALTPEEILQGKVRKKERLGQWLATAICGNDITSSCLYVSGIVIVYAEALAPLALLLAAGVLYLYRKIYTEVVEALPLDGGAYNALLNCTRKFDASFAACLTLLSYLATAVISAKTAAEYSKDLLRRSPHHGDHGAGLLVLFAGLTILGITDSARVALAIFVLHLVTLTLLVVWILSSSNLTPMWSLIWPPSCARKAIGPRPCFWVFPPPCWGSAALRVPPITWRSSVPGSFA